MDDVGGGSKHARRAVSDGTVDIAVVLDDAVESPNLVTARIAPETLCLLAAPRSPTSRNPSDRARTPQGQPMVLTKFGCGYRARAGWVVLVQLVA